METVYETDLTSHGLLSPLSPQSPQTPPMSPPSPYQESYRKVNNPLIDLIETEKKYLKDLKCLLQQVTACWSNDDLPPPELDLMFRHVEVIYKQNKKFYLKLDKIGSNSASAKDLGETLLIWIDDMDDPYTNYVENFKLGFDSIPEIEENLNLQQTLNDISAEKNQPVSLDYFFDMPLKRLHYYKKLYLRLYRTTEPGRADNSLLLTANERIDRLLELEKKIKSSNKIKEFTSSTPAAENVDSSTVISSDSEDVSSVIVSPTIEIHQIEDSKKQNSIITNIPSINSQTIDSPVDPTVSTDKVQPVKRNWTLEELESQLDTSKTRDLFTKLPKIVKVSILSKDLPFERKIVIHDDFIIETTKSVNSTETHYINVHIFLLTDLLLICQEITQEEKQKEKVLKLIYPPFNTYHLAINEVSDDQEDSLELTILQKEMIILYANNKDTKDNWFREINKAIEISSNDPKSPKSNPRLSMISTISMSSDALKRSPSVGNLINKDKSMRPMSTISQSVGNLINKDKSMRPVSSISQGPNLFPDFSSTDPPIIRSRTPDPPQNAGGQYPGDYLPSEQGKGQERHNSDPISSPGIRNKLTVGLQAERANSMASLVSVESIANFKETIFRSSACEVFRWINGVWKLLTKKDKCIVEVRLTVQNKGCWAILLESSNRMVLNAWVHSATSLHREDENSVSISCEIGQRVEYYKISTINSAESDQFNNCISKIKESAKELNVPAEKFISRSSSLQTIEPLREVEQTITQVMEVKCRVFLQNDHGVWTNIGWGNMKLSIETPSHRKRIIVNSDKKTKTIIDSIINEDGVEKIGKNSVALTLNNTGSNLRIIYLLRMKDEEMATKVFDVMKEKRKK